MSQITVATVLRSHPWVNPRGKVSRFTAAHAEWLHKQIRQHWDGNLICLSDTQVPGVDVRPLKYSWPGWWAKAELFSADLQGDLLYLDIDTVVRGDLKPLAGVKNFTMLRDFYKPTGLGSGLMFLPESTRAELWGHWVKGPGKWMAECTTSAKWGDQGFITTVMGSKAQTWQGVMPGKVLSYKVHCRHRPPLKETSVVCFHGTPRPWQVGRSWVPPAPKS